MNDLQPNCFIRVNDTLLLSAIVICKRNSICETDVLLCQDRICTATPTDEVVDGSISMNTNGPLKVYVKPENVEDLLDYGRDY